MNPIPRNSVYKSIVVQMDWDGLDTNKIYLDFYRRSPYFTFWLFKKSI